MFSTEYKTFTPATALIGRCETQSVDHDPPDTQMIHHPPGPLAAAGRLQPAGGAGDSGSRFHWQQLLKTESLKKNVGALPVTLLEVLKLTQ